MEELIVPLDRKSYTMNELEKIADKEYRLTFHNKVREILVNIVHPLWEKHLGFKYTETALCISTNGFGGKNYYMVKKGKPWNPKPEHIENMKEYVLSRIKSNEDRESRNKKYDYLKGLLTPIFERFSKKENFRFILNSDFSIDIRLMGKKEGEEDYLSLLDYKIKCTLQPSGEITTPQTEKHNITTLEHARQYLLEFDNLNKEIECVAVALKSLLPTEYFSAGKIILKSPAISESIYKYRYVLDVNREIPMKSVLRVEQQFTSGEWGGTPGTWYVGTLLNVEGYFGNKQNSDYAIIDGGQKWMVSGLIEALKEVQKYL